jgi:hypothetical protein
MRRLLVILVAQAGFLAAGAGASAESVNAATVSGITGRVVASPTCPVESVPPRPGCSPRPLVARVRITRKGWHAIIVRSGRDGRFQVNLAPGTYVVQGLPVSSSGLPRPPGPVTVRVARQRRTRVVLSYDTGIR